MSAPPQPNPPKPCPVCHVAMQESRLGDETVHRCERCSLTIAVKAPARREERQARQR